jgi:hypothetical protein
MQLDASDLNLRQRYIIALLAFEFRKISWLSDGDECEWNGVSCDDGGKVITLDLCTFQLHDVVAQLQFSLIFNTKVFSLEIAQHTKN